MDSSQHAALAALIRRVVRADVDEVVARLDQLEGRALPVEDLARRVAALETINGVRPRAVGVTARRARVEQLPRPGASRRD